MWRTPDAVACRAISSQNGIAIAHWRSSSRTASSGHG